MFYLLDLEPGSESCTFMRNYPCLVREYFGSYYSSDEPTFSILSSLIIWHNLEPIIPAYILRSSTSGCCYKLGSFL